MGLCVTLLSVGPTNAAPVSFVDEDAFIQATSPQSFEDFNAVPPADFAGSSATVGNMTFSGPFSPNHPNQLGIVNYIGEHFLQSITVDGTQAIYGLTTRADRFRIDFLNPVTSWGATFYDLADENRETDLRFYDGSETLLGNILVSGQDQDALSFHGIDLDVQAASYVEFVQINAPNVEEFFIIDNVRSSVARDVDPSLAPVPLPASSLCLLSGGIAMVALRRRRARQNPCS